MKRILISFISILLLCCNAFSQTQLTTTECIDLYKSIHFNQASIHDPSVVWNSTDQTFYVFGSHYCGAKSKDLRNWTGISRYYKGGYDSKNAYKAFKSNPERKVNRILPGKTIEEEVVFPSYDASSYASTFADIKLGDRNPTTEADWVSGCQWAPDLVWNSKMNKWCYYLSINGDNWASVIVLMTSDNVEGPYTYQGPIVFGGFTGKTYKGEGLTGTEETRKVDYKKTDLEIVLGEQKTLPSRYNTSSKDNGTYWPNPIDPCVFFDEDGEMWLAYGSWSGGIFMLKLDKNTGLRDYTYTYNGTGTTLDANVASDAYYGLRIAGGWYVSGEGPYIQHIGNYYYLFMSYGGFAPDGGYEMRVFRSEKPTGPYIDASNQPAIFKDGYVLNFGSKATTNRGMKLIGAMNHWGLMEIGECAQGHNSACVDDMGRSFLVCHTKFNNGTLGHSVRAYQLYLNKEGWLVTAPFQFAGETTTDKDIATKKLWSAADIEGDYHILIHPYRLDHSKMQEATPSTIHLSADGKVTGDYKGTWKFLDGGSSYFQIVINSVTYSGVVIEQTLENNTAKTLCFTTICSMSGNANCGVPCWGYKLQPQSAIAYNYQQNTDYFKTTSLASVSKNVDIMFDPTDNVKLEWTSSNPDVLSETGKYNAPVEETEVKMTARLSSGNYYWEKEFTTKVKPATEVTGDQITGLVAYYNFDESPARNLYNTEQRATFSKFGSGKTPTLENDWSRFGSVLHQSEGVKGQNSYVRVPNPLLDKSLSGFTVSMWVKRHNANIYDALWSFFSGTLASSSGARLFLNGNTYLGYNDEVGNWFDVNHPDTKLQSYIKENVWSLVTLTMSKENGYTLYVDGVKKVYVGSSLCSYDGSVSKKEFDYGAVVDFVSQAKYFYLGFGSYYGSANASFDDLMFYDRELTADDVKGLSVKLNRVNDFFPAGTTSLQGVYMNTIDEPCNGIYDLYGRRVAVPLHGIYVVNGKKVNIK